MRKRSPRARPAQILAGGACHLTDVADTSPGSSTSAGRRLALYVGGMGARGKNFYNDLVRRYGCEAEAKEIQDLYLDGKKHEAAAMVPLELLEMSNLVGPASYVKERVAAFREFRSHQPPDHTGCRRPGIPGQPDEGVGVLMSESREIFEPEHESFRQTVRSFIEKEVTPYQQWEKDGVVDRSVWTKAGELGLLCFDVDEQYGGAGVKDFRYNMVMAEELTRAGANGPGFLVHTDIIVPYISSLGTEEQKQRWLPGLVSGELISAIAMTEPGAGSDLQGIRTHASTRATTTS